MTMKNKGSNAFCAADSEKFKFDSFTDRVPPHAAPSGSEFVFTTRVLRRYAANVRLVINKDGETAQHIHMNWSFFEGGYDFVTATLRLDTGLYWYHFENDNEEFFRENGGSWQITVYDKDFTTPDWIKGGIIYHIFVDRFFKGKEIKPKDYAFMHTDKLDEPFYKPDENGIVKNTDFFGGNLDGIIKKLPYIKSLGVTAIYLSPVFEAESNHKYDTGNYENIDPMFGNEKDFKTLCSKASKLGIRIICDGVFNHTGADSIYFNKYGRYDSVGAYNSPDSPYYSWYNFQKYPDEYSCWWSIKILPATNKENEEFVNYITGETGIVRKWIKNGASSWRLDVADELNDKMLDGIRAAAKAENPDSLIIGEVWEDASNKIAYGNRRRYLLGKQLDSVMNYPLKNAIIDFVKTGNAKNLNDTVLSQKENYPPQVVNCLMNILGTHDTERILTALGRDRDFSSKDDMSGFKLTENQLETAKKRLFAAAVLQMTLPGVPCIYYGDEAGMQGGADPFNRAYFPWGNEDKDLLAFYKKITSLRRSMQVFEKGEYIPALATNGILIFKRTDETGNVTVAVNVSDKPFELKSKLHDEIENKEITEIKDFAIFKNCKNTFYPEEQ